MDARIVVKVLDTDLSVLSARRAPSLGRSLPCSNTLRGDKVVSTGQDKEIKALAAVAGCLPGHLAARLPGCLL